MSGVNSVSSYTNEGLLLAPRGKVLVSSCTNEALLLAPRGKVPKRARLRSYSTNPSLSSFQTSSGRTISNFFESALNTSKTRGKLFLDSSSPVLQKSLFEKSLFDRLLKALEAFRSLPQNWDSYGAEPPNEAAIYWTKIVLDLLLSIDFPPSRITPSVEGGIGISFICGHKYADIECLNTEEILAVTSNRDGNPSVWEVDRDKEAIKFTLEKISVFISGN